MRMVRTLRLQWLLFVLFPLLVLLPALTSQGGAPSPIGTVREVRSGVLERQDRELWKPLTAGMVIYANDRVRTSVDGSSVLSLNEIGAILVGPGTEYYLGDPARGFKTLLKRGYLWISASLTSGRTMSVATANAITGVRGTKFSVIQDAAGTEVCTCKGIVEVSIRDGKTMNVAGGMYGTVDASGKLGAPEKGKARLEKIWKEKPDRYAPCLTCHKKGKKVADLN